MATKTSPPDEGIRIVAPDEQRCVIRIKGTSSLLTNRMNEKAIAKLTEIAPTKRGGPKLFDDPEEVWKSHLHVIDAEFQRYGIPGAALHAALIKAGRFIEGVFMSELRGMFRIPFGLLEIQGPPPSEALRPGSPSEDRASDADLPPGVPRVGD